MTWTCAICGKKSDQDVCPEYRRHDIAGVYSVTAFVDIAVEHPPDNESDFDYCTGGTFCRECMATALREMLNLCEVLKPIEDA